MKRLAILLVALLLAGCSTQYVPVETNVAKYKSKAPRVCHGDLETVEDMQPFDANATHPTPVMINAAWSKHDLKRREVDKRNARKWSVCRIWIKHREEHP